MHDENPHLDNELNQMTSNPQVARAVRANLEKLSQGVAGPAMAEMAKELLAGRTSLREVGRSSAYAEDFAAAAAKYRQWYSELTPEEREKLHVDTRAALDDQDENRASRS